MQIFSSRTHKMDSEFKWLCRFMVITDVKIV